MRSAGQLTENVTEARMLQSKIMDMSKERFKYITQADYNMKFFLAGQKRKSKLMPELLHGVDISYWLNKKTARHVPKFTSSSASNARFAFLERMETSGQKCKDFEAEENPFAMPEQPKMPEKQVPEFYRIRLKEMEEEEMAKATFQTQPILRPSTMKQVKFCDKEKKEDVKLPQVKSAKSLPAKTAAADEKPSLGSGEKQSRRVQSVPLNSTRSVEDPRYKYLEGSLSGKHIPARIDTHMVQSIITSLDSLHVPSKQTAANSRPKLQRTILEYLRARGFDV